MTKWSDDVRIGSAWLKLADFIILLGFEKWEPFMRNPFVLGDPETDLSHSAKKNSLQTVKQRTRCSLVWTQVILALTLTEVDKVPNDCQRLASKYYTAQAWSVVRQGNQGYTAKIGNRLKTGNECLLMSTGGWSIFWCRVTTWWNLQSIHYCKQRTLVSFDITITLNRLK